MLFSSISPPYQLLFFYEKSIFTAILDHLEAWFFKIESDNEILAPLKQKCFLQHCNKCADPEVGHSYTEENLLTHLR